MPQPCRFSEAKSLCFRKYSTSRIKPRSPWPRTPKTRSQKNTCWRRLPQPPAPQCRSPARFLKQKAYVFACTQIPEPNPPAQGSGPRLHGPRAQASLGPGPKPQPSGHRAQAPSSKIWCPLPGARRTCRKLIKSEWLRCAQRRAIFLALAAKQGTKLNRCQTRTSKQQRMSSFEVYVLRAAPSDFLGSRRSRRSSDVLAPADLLICVPAQMGFLPC